MDACMLLYVLMSLEPSINTPCRFFPWHAGEGNNMFSSGSIAEMKENEAVMDQRLRINVNSVALLLLPTSHKVDCCHCIVYRTT